LRQQKLAAQAVLEAEEKERRRIAGDLHDTVGQMMSAVKVNLSMLETEIPFENDKQQQAYRKVLSLVDESCKEVRVVSHNIMPNALKKAGFATAIRDFIEHLDPRIVKINFYMDGLDGQLGPNVETVLYRVVQECVNNVITHAKATTLDICIIKDNDGITATLEDNGVGFDTAAIASAEGIGLKNIQSRIDFLKGTVEWNSSPGRGTLVAIHIPAEVI